MKQRERSNAGVSALAPLGERVAGNRRFHQPGPDGPTPAEGDWRSTNDLGFGPQAGEGVKPVKTPYPYRQTRSLARMAGQIDKARQFRQTPTEAVLFFRPRIYSCKRW